MGTIFIHFHQDDRFAAEMLAGALVDCATLALWDYRSEYGAPEIAFSDSAERHIVLWTDQAATLPQMQALLLRMMRRRTALLLLTQDESLIPPELDAKDQLPLFDRGVSWPVYRAAFRRRLGYGEIPVSRRPHAAQRLAPIHQIEGLVRDSWVRANLPIVAITGGILLWTIMR